MYVIFRVSPKKMTGCYRVMNCGIALSTGSSPDLFPEHKKMPAFRWPNFFVSPGDPDFFFKNRNCLKIHGEAITVTLVVQPTVGQLSNSWLIN